MRNNSEIVGFCANKQEQQRGFLSMCPRTECSILRATLVIMLLTLTSFCYLIFSVKPNKQFLWSFAFKDTEEWLQLPSGVCSPWLPCHISESCSLTKAQITKSWAGGRNSYWTREEAWGLPKYQNKSEGGISCGILPLCFKKLRHQIFIYFLIFESQANKHEEVMQHVSCYVRQEGILAKSLTFISQNFQIFMLSSAISQFCLSSELSMRLKKYLSIALSRYHRMVNYKL